MVTVTRIATTVLPTRFGTFEMSVFHGPDQLDQVVLTVGQIADGAPVLVRLHSECLTGDIFGSARCDCGEQLDESMAMIQREGRGVLLYLRQEGRGIGLVNKLRAYSLQDQGYDTVDANRLLGLPDDSRRYDEAAAILHYLGVRQVQLITNNPAKIDGLALYGFEIVERVPLHITPNPTNIRYLHTKRERMGHIPPETLEIPTSIRTTTG
jgi:GTP cyclohydrolase II